MYLELDGKGPAYEQLVRALRSGIKSGRFPRGMKLSPSRELSKKLGISRNTVTMAYDRLLSDGWLYARVGSGTFVAAGKPVQRQMSSPSPGPLRLSDLGERLLERVDMRNIPGRVPEGMKHAFQYGAPYTNHTLLSSWANALRKAASYANPGYNRSQGIEALRVQIAEYLGRRRGVLAHPDDVIVVAGSQQAIALCTRLLLNAGDVALIEEPHYFPVSAILHAYGIDIVTADVDEEGLRVDSLEQTQPKCIFVTPTHQFPLGHVLGSERRRVLLEYAAKKDAWIIEDDYDGEFRYDNNRPPTLKSADKYGRVIYVGTFSKALFPAIRLGYMVVPPALRKAFTAAKFIEDMGASVVDQTALADLLGNGTFDRHLVRAGKELMKRRAALVSKLSELSPPLEVSDSRAGMHLVVRRSDWSSEDVDQLIAIAHDKGLALFPTSPFYLRETGQPALLMGYASCSVSEIASGMRLFRAALAELDGPRESSQSRHSGSFAPR